MSLDHLLGLAAATGVVIYLVVALLFPERY